MRYGLGIDSEEKRARVTCEDILNAYKKNLSNEFTQTLWLKFRMCFQLVELILKIRDTVLVKSKMKPILNGLYWVQHHSKNLENLECVIE